MITLILGKKNLFMIFHCLIGHSFVIMSCQLMTGLTIFIQNLLPVLILMHVPKKNVTRRNLKLRTKPWINGEIHRLMSYRDKLFLQDEQ